MEFDTATGPSDLTGNGTATALVSLTYLKSYRGMGTADVACVSGCQCTLQQLDGTWKQEVSLQQVLQFEVGAACCQAGGGRDLPPAGRLAQAEPLFRYPAAWLFAAPAGSCR